MHNRHMPTPYRDIRILTFLVEVEIIDNRITSFVLKLRIDSILVKSILREPQV